MKNSFLANISSFRRIKVNDLKSIICSKFLRPLICSPLLEGFLTAQCDAGALHGMILTAWSIGGVGGGLGFTSLFDKHKPSAATASLPGAFDKAYESNFRWILGVLIFGLVMLFFVRTDPVDRSAPGWRYSILGKKVVHLKRKDSSAGKVTDLQNGTASVPNIVVENL